MRNNISSASESRSRWQQKEEILNETKRFLIKFRRSITQTRHKHKENHGIKRTVAGI